MSDWDPSSGGPPRIGNRSGEAAALGFLRGIVNWFGSLDSLTVVFGTCAVTCAVVFFIMQMSSSSRREAASAPSAALFQDATNPEPQVPEVHARGPRDRMLSALDFVPKMPEQTPAPVKEEPKTPDPGPQIKPPVIPTPQVAVAPTAPPANPLAGMKMPTPGGAASGSSGVAAGARIGAPQQEEKQQAARASPALGPVAGNAEGGDSEIARKLIPLVRLYQQSGNMQKYNETAGRNYAIEFGKAVMERQLTISTSTVVTAKDAHALVEGLGIHLPKNNR